MNFKDFSSQLNKQIDKVISDVNHLFVVEVDKDEMYSLYLSSFPEGSNPIYRERTQHDCSCCKGFIKNFGNVVSIKDGEINTIWEFDAEDKNYQLVVNALAEYVKSKVINGIFVTDIVKFGAQFTNEVSPSGVVIRHEHFNYELPQKFKTDLRSTTIGTVENDYNTRKQVFKRSLDEISQDAIETVLELIAQSSLYKGEEWKGVLTQFLVYKKEYSKLNTDEDREIYTWYKSTTIGDVIGKIKNHSIGTLLIDISEGVSLDEAVAKYEKIVAPTNYKRPKAIFTKKMIEEAQKKIEELGLNDSLGRRYANIDDITVNNILFVDRDNSNKIKGATDIFEQLKSNVAQVPKNLDKVEEVSIERFVKEILPTTTKVEVLVENKHSSNLMSLIAPKVKDSKTMFKWDNGFSWAYAGNITDSDMREQVKAAGGSVTGVLRFSIRWNDKSFYDRNDLDAHCILPNTAHICFSNTRHSTTKGHLDVDIMNPKKDSPAIENIAFPDLSLLQEGDYQFFVRQFANRGGTEGFSAEIEFDGQIYSFEYPKELKHGENISVAIVNYSKQNGFTIKNAMESSLSQRDIWSCKTNTFVPVKIIMHSPNYWDEQDGIGNKHYFFMVDKCINPENPSGFFNEYLNNELLPYRKVMEALTTQMRVEDDENQLSGLGFSSTLRNTLTCKITGNTNRIIKIKF